eukprot:scaffold136823_cov33-Tisochrysis_lutea.AAC.4
MADDTTPLIVREAAGGAAVAVMVESMLVSPALGPPLAALDDQGPVCCGIERTHKPLALIEDGHPSRRACLHREAQSCWCIWRDLSPEQYFVFIMPEYTCRYPHRGARRHGDLAPHNLSRPNCHPLEL